MSNQPDSVMIDLASPTAVVCHDAGSTNLIISWLKAAESMVVRPFMEGPAEKLWRVAFPELNQCSSLEEAINGAHSLLSGTGWASSLEHQARQMANARGVWSVAVLDHWVNYASRFEREGVVMWPDEVWVADSYALKIAQNVIPKRVNIRQLDNLYLRSQVAKVGVAPGDGTVLVVLEPVRSNWGRDLEGEFQALDYLFEHIDSLWPKGVTHVLLRLHPSEPKGKYQIWLDRYPAARIDTSIDIAAAISQADVVVGLESFALTIALAAGRPVYSSLPPWAPKLRLPHVGIQQLRILNDH